MYPGNGMDGPDRLDSPLTGPQSMNSNVGRRGYRAGRGRMIAAVALASVLAGGAAFGAVTVLGSGPAAASPTGQAAVLNSALTSAALPSSAAPATAGRHHRHPLSRFRLLSGIDGQFTFETKTGPRTLAFERGTIESVAGGQVVVRAVDGTTWSWKLVSDSVVRENGKKTTASALSAGERVFAGGPVVNGTHDARLIVIRAAKKSGGSGSASGSTGTSTS